MRYIKTPTDILRFLWYEKTGYVQIIEPSVLEKNARRQGHHICPMCDKSLSYEERMKASLKLKYGRKNCKMVSSWMNALPLSATGAAENMNPKRGMWVRFIRALRMAEYAKRKGFEHLAEILDVFYNQNYSTWQGNVDKARIANDPDRALSILQKRPGAFARCLFASMLRFGADETLEAFDQVADQLPARLLVSLGNAAEIYFDKREVRSVGTITGSRKVIGKNKLLALYSDDECKCMVEKVEGIYKKSMYRRFKTQVTESKSIYIAPELYDIPVSVGDRSTTIQDSRSPNLMVGWMNSENEMKISEKNGVAYDPSCVQHMVRVTDNNLSKGLVFGVLDIRKREIIWLEMPFVGQTLRSLSTLNIEALLERLRQKLKLGELLKMKADAQGLEIVEDASLADEEYTYEWALNPTEVNKLLF